MGVCRYSAGSAEGKGPGRTVSEEVMHMSILKTSQLKKYYGSGDTLVKALDGVDLSVELGEFVAIVGTSGSGKSTLLHMLGGLDRPTAGKVWVDGKDISKLKDEELTIFRRRKIGFVFQSYNLVPVLNVYENIVLPVELDGNTGRPGVCGGYYRHTGAGDEEIQPAFPALRRPAAEGGHRPGTGGKAGHPFGRRTYRQSGLCHKPGRSRPSEGHQ